MNYIVLYDPSNLLSLAQVIDWYRSKYKREPQSIHILNGWLFLGYLTPEEYRALPSLPIPDGTNPYRDLPNDSSSPLFKEIQPESTMPPDPRIAYTSRIILIHQQTNQREKLYAVVGEFGHTATSSLDDAGRGHTSSNLVREIWVANVPDWKPLDAVAWLNTNYPGARIAALDVTPESLRSWLATNSIGIWPLKTPGTPAPAPTPTPAPTTKPLFGLHFYSGAGGINADEVLVAKQARIETAKITTNSPPSNFDWLVRDLGIAPDRVMLRLLANFSQYVSPQTVYGWYGEPTGTNMNYPLSWFKAKGGKLVEVFNEPNNIYATQDGYGILWKNPAEWSAWWRDFIVLCKRDYPTLSFGLPGLAPADNFPIWLLEYKLVKSYANWVGLHCYWQLPDQTTQVEHGGYWMKSEVLGLSGYITEASNVNPTASFEDKATQYVKYPTTLPSWVKGVYYYIARTTREDEIRNRQYWVSTPISVIVGKRS